MSNQIRQISVPTVASLVLKATCAIKTGLVKSRLSQCCFHLTAVHAEHCSTGMGTAWGQRLFLFAGLFFRWLLQRASWHFCSSEMEQPKQELAGGRAGRRAGGGRCVPGACLSRAGAPCGRAKWPKRRCHTDKPRSCWPQCRPQEHCVRPFPGLRAAQRVFIFPSVLTLAFTHTQSFAHSHGVRMMKLLERLRVAPEHRCRAGPVLGVVVPAAGICQLSHAKQGWTWQDLLRHPWGKAAAPAGRGTVV